MSLSSNGVCARYLLSNDAKITIFYVIPTIRY